MLCISLTIVESTHKVVEDTSSARDVVSNVRLQHRWSRQQAYLVICSYRGDAARTIQVTMLTVYKVDSVSSVLMSSSGQTVGTHASEEHWRPSYVALPY